MNKQQIKRWLLGTRPVRIAGWVVAAFALLSVAGQLLYPADRALPLMRVGDLDVSWKDRASAQKQLRDFSNNSQVTIKTPSRSWQTKWPTIGLGVDQEATADVAVRYELWERLIPFSSVAKILQSRQAPLIGLIDEERLQAFAAKVVSEDRQAAKDASIRIEKGAVKIDEAKSGYRFTQDNIEQQVRRASLQTSITLELVPESVPSARTSAELQAAATEAERMLNRSLKLKVLDKTYTPDRPTIGTWITFVEDTASKQLRPALNKEAIKTYLEGINKDVKINPGTVTVTLLDGQEISRTSAPMGRTVATDATAAAIEAELRGTHPAKQIGLPITTVPPGVQYVRTYSQQSSGLQAIVNDWDRGNYGDFAIIVRELGGSGRYAELQPDKRMVTASTFKMFLAYVVLGKIERSELSFGQRTDMGWTVDECLRAMIVNSTNPCAISLLNLVGWGVADDILHAAGFSATRLNNQGGGEKYSTVRDEANFLTRLYFGSLLNSDQSQYLLGLMKRQIWRAGIPNGVPSWVVVANKVGLYDGWVHDVAIVYGPKSTYVLAIMTRGGSDPQFTDLSRRVYNFFNQ